jgi:hypothetical protein
MRDIVPAMNVDKARKILSDYAKNNYNAKKTLLENGYSEMTAAKVSGDIIKRATRAVSYDVAHKPLGEISRSETKRAIEILGLTDGEVANTLKKIATNDRDYASALKVLAVLAKEIGVNLTTEETKTQPLLNITVESGNSDKEPDNITGHLSSNVVEKTAGDTAASYVENVDECQEVLSDGEGDIGEEEGER